MIVLPETRSGAPGLKLPSAPRMVWQSAYVDPGMLPVVVGAGVGLDLDPEDAGRGIGDVRERPPGPGRVVSARFNAGRYMPR